MDALHQFMRRRHEGQHQDRPGGHGHVRGATDSGSRMMALLNMLMSITHIDHEWLSDYRASRLVPAPNKVIAITILAFAAGVVGWLIMPGGLKITALVVAIVASAYFVILVLGGMSILLFVRHIRSVVRQTVLDSVPWQGTETVLDVACGTGMLLNGCAQKLTTGRAVGIDLWQQAVGGSPEVLLANARAEGVADRVEYQEMDARHLSFEAESFEVVVSSLALHHIGSGREDCEQAVGEMIRVLAPGGIISLVDIPPMIESAETVLLQSGLQITWQQANRFLRFVTARKP